MKEEKIGKISELIYYNEGNCYTIAVFETETEQLFAVGNMMNPERGRRYRLCGQWTNHPRYGEQFAFSSFEELMPTTKDGIAEFLASGVIKGVGPKMAKTIVDMFGEQTLDVLSREPERLTAVPGIGRVKAEAIEKGYAEHREFANTVLALSSYDISAAVAMKLYKAYGVGAVDILKQNPYQLISDVYGMGFVKADKVAQAMGFALDSPHRIKSGIMHVLNNHVSQGDTFVEKAGLFDDVAELLDVSREAATEALFDLVMDGSVFQENLGGSEAVMTWRYHKAEQSVAGNLYALCHSELSHIAKDVEKLIASTEKSTGITLSDSQKLAVISSLKNGVSVITGGPGTGKTTIINTILAILQANDVKTALAAPTGRAAKRMTETTGCEASTIHRLLEYSYSESDDEMRFGRTEENPLEYQCVIIDEASMVDILLMEGLLNAIKPGTRLILVGDADQLPSVGAGNVLRDIISSGTVHATRLKDIFRQAQESLIVVNAHLINKGEYPFYNEKDKDFFFMERENEQAILKTLKDLCVRRLPAYYDDIDPFSDIQVLTPTRKGLLGSVELNVELQSILNPKAADKSEKTFGKRIYREGDKVMQNKNDYTLSWKNLNDFSDGQGVFNGDIGVIQTVDNDSGTISVLFDGERLATYDYSNIEELETAYAMTVHKSQGSEFPVVVMPMTRVPYLLATRNLLYTAVTRAKRGVVLVGMRDICNAMVDNNSIIKRNSGLGFRLERLWGFEDDKGA